MTPHDAPPAVPGTPSAPPKSKWPSKGMLIGVIVMVAGQTIFMARYREQKAQEEVYTCTQSYRLAVGDKIHAAYMALGKMPAADDVTLPTSVGACLQGSYRRVSDHEAQVIIPMDGKKSYGYLGTMEVTMTSYGCGPTSTWETTTEWACHLDANPAEQQRFFDQSCRHRRAQPRTHKCPDPSLQTWRLAPIAPP